MSAALVYYTKVLALTRLTNSAKMVMDLNKEFNSTEMRDYRRAFADDLLERRPIDLRDHAPVLEFFEEVGYMAKRDVLDEGMVWNSFTWLVEPYYVFCEGAIKQARKATQRPSLFCEVEWLYGKLLELDKKHEKNPNYLGRSDEDCRRLLEQERVAGASRPRERAAATERDALVP